MKEGTSYRQESDRRCAPGGRRAGHTYRPPEAGCDLCRRAGFNVADPQKSLHHRFPGDAWSNAPDTFLKRAKGAKDDSAKHAKIF